MMMMAMMLELRDVPKTTLPSESFCDDEWLTVTNGRTSRQFHEEILLKHQTVRKVVHVLRHLEQSLSDSKELSQRLVRYCSVEDATLEGAVCCR